MLSQAKKYLNEDNSILTLKSKNSTYIYEILDKEEVVEALATTYFGLHIYKNHYVKESDIKKLPFYDFWLESSKGSGMLVKDSEILVFLNDWENFSRLFISSGKHRWEK